MSSYNYGIWKGTNIHAYTSDVKRVFDERIAARIAKTYGAILHKEQFDELLNELKSKYGEKITYQNFQNVYDKNTGTITDSEVPSLNVAILLKATWDEIKKANDESLYRHFGETLDQIGMTCIVGISHRLMIDYVAVTVDK